MNLKAILSINTKSIISLSMKHSSSDKAKNQFTVRQWIQFLTINDNDKPRIILRDEQNIISEIELKPEIKGGRHILTASNDTGDVYTWGTLTPGYGKTYGLTAGIMFRKRANFAPIIDTNVLEFQEGDGI